MSAKWVVRCEDYTSGPYKSQEAAESALERIQQSEHCRLEHKVEEAKR